MAAAAAAPVPNQTEDHGPTEGQPLFQAPPSEAGNGSLPPSAPKTPPTYAQMTSHTGNGSLPPSAPKTPPTDAKSATPNQGLPTSSTLSLASLGQTFPTSPTTVSSMLYGQYHRWRQRLWPQSRQGRQPHCQHHQLTCNSFVLGTFLKTLAELATVLVGECVNMYLSYLAYITFTWLPINKALHSMFWVSCNTLFPMHTSACRTE